MRYFLPFLCGFLFLASGCVEDYDVQEVAPAEHLSEEHAHEDDHDDCEDEEHHDHSAPSGHSHGQGVRNHGTQWFFNQPWAAPFIWGKLARDGAIFLIMAVAIFLLSRRRKR